MYFGDWLRSSDVVNVWYLSYRSDDPEFPKRIDDMLKRDGRVQKISSTCLLVESTDVKKTMVKKLQKIIKPDEEVVFLYPHQRVVGYQILESQQKD